MLLILSNSEDATANYLCKCMADSERQFVRIDTDIDINSLNIEFSSGSSPKIICPKFTISSDLIENIWYRRPKPLHSHLEDMTPEKKHAYSEKLEALEGFFAHIPAAKWMNHPSYNVNASRKMEQLTRAKKFGLRIPETIITQSVTVLDSFLCLYGSVITKPISSGYIERSVDSCDSQIFTNEVSPKMDFTLLEKCPTLFQQKIDKKLDVRITIIDNSLTAIGLTKNAGNQQILDIRRDNMANVVYSKVEVPHDIRCKLLKFVQSYNLRFSAIDMVIAKDDTWFFLENNPNGQWAWLDIYGGTSLYCGFLEAFRPKVKNEVAN